MIKLDIRYKLQDISYKKESKLSLQGFIEAITIYFPVFTFFLLFSLLPNLSYAHPAFEIQDALSSLEEGDLDKAESLLQKSRFEEPDSFIINYDLGIVSYRKRDYAKSVRFFARASELCKTPEERFDAFYNMGNAAFKGYDFSLAVTAYKNALAVKNDYQAEYNLKVAEKKLQEMLERMKKEQEKQQEQQQNQQNQQQNQKKDGNEQKQSGSDNSQNQDSSQKQDNQQNQNNQDGQDNQNNQNNQQQGNQSEQQKSENGQQNGSENNERQQIPSKEEQDKEQQEQQSAQNTQSENSESKDTQEEQQNGLNKDQKEQESQNGEDKESKQASDKDSQQEQDKQQGEAQENKEKDEDSQSSKVDDKEQNSKKEEKEAQAVTNEETQAPEEDRRDVKMAEDKGKVSRPEASQKARAMKNIRLNKKDVEEYLKKMEAQEAERQMYYRINNIEEKDPAYMNQDELREWMKIRNRKRERSRTNKQDW